MPHARHPYGDKRRGKEKVSINRGCLRLATNASTTPRPKRVKENAGLAMISAPGPACQKRRCAQVIFNKRRLMYELEQEMLALQITFNKIITCLRSL